MSKSINVHEACIITKDDKGNLSCREGEGSPHLLAEE